MNLAIRHTNVFSRNYDALLNNSIRFIVNQGGTRSSKTYSICQLLIWYALTHKNKVISIARKTFPALSNSVLQDLLQILSELQLEGKYLHNKSTHTFTFFTGTKISFFSIDDPQKIRGRRHDVVFLNEANELTFDDFQQINFRTSTKIIVDFNPSDEFSWIWDLLKDPKTIKIHSTYKDNPFLSESIVREIENLVNVDENYYRIYTLGELASGKEKVFSNVHIGPFPQGLDYIYGLDFGFNDPCALVKIAISDGTLYIKQLLYESYLTTEALIARMEKLGISKNHTIYADAARPDQISSLANAGFYVQKGKKNIQEGIDFMRTLRIVIDPTSEETYKEFRTYSYKKVRGIVTDTPVDYMNHSIDATRYAAISKKSEGLGVSFMV